LEAASRLDEEVVIARKLGDVWAAVDDALGVSSCPVIAMSDVSNI
jgi:hypothetical protein